MILRRSLKGVMDVLDAMTRDGISLARLVELTAQWYGILRVGPVGRVTREDLRSAGGGGLGECRRVDFTYRVVVHRRNEATRGWRNWLREDPLVHPYRWLRPDLVPHAPFYSVTLILLLVVLGCSLIRPGSMRNSERLGFPIFLSFWAKGGQP